MAIYRFIIDNEEELSDGILRIAIEQLQYIKEQAKIPQNMDVSVHEIRKAFKRLRALLRLIRYDIGEELFLTENIKYKEWGRALSRVRDLHVIITYLAGCFEAEELVIKEMSFIPFIDYLNKQKEVEMKVLMEGALMNSVIDKCNKQINTMSHYPLSDLGPHTIHNGVIHAYKRCHDKMKSAQIKLDDETLHQLRKKVKYLYNQMLLMQAVWPDYFVNYSSALRSASELLGDDHNLAETIIIVEEVPDEVLREEEKLSLIKSLTMERRQIHDEVWPLLGKVFAESPTAFAKRIKSYWLISRE